MITELVRSKTGLTAVESEYMARNLLIHVPILSPSHTNEDVVTVFKQHENIIGLPIIENNKPIGLINRNVFMDGMAKPYYRDLFGRKSCIAFMDKSPLVVEETLGIQDLSFQVVASGRKSLNDGFIITSADGQYLGVGTGEDLVKVITNLQAEKNRLVMESINYASVIQSSFLRSSNQDLATSLSDYYLHWEPRDKVGGDYYYCKKFDDGFFLALIDCTGHGVPGAFMTLIMASFIDHILIEDNCHDPANALSVLNRKVKSALGQIAPEQIEGNDPTAETRNKFHKMMSQDGSDDGMDAVFIWVNTTNKKIIYSGAKTPLFYIRKDDDEVQVLAANKKGVGYINTPMDFKWGNTELEITEGMCVYLTTDGIIDQIGGEKSIAFGKKRYTELLMKYRELPMAQQKDELINAFYQYQNKEKRRDDVSAIGFKL